MTKPVKIAVIGCEPKNSIKFSHGGSRHDIRHLLRKKIKALGDRYEPLVHWPANNIRDFPDSKKIDAVMIPGSPLNIDDETLGKTDWMKKLLDFIAHVHGKVPMLGICFGHQAIARTFGSSIMSYTKKKIFYEIGFEITKMTDKGKDEQKDGIFKDIPERFPALYSHFQYVGTVPQDGSVLATSINHKNKSIQAYKIGNMTYGVQFHPDYNEANLMEIIQSRNALIIEHIGLRPLIRSVNERHDHKIIKNFLDII